MAKTGHKSANNKVSLSTVLHKVRVYEMRLRKAMSGHLTGSVLTLSKGSGLEFDDVRPYQYGDDVRAIDWNVSAKGLGTYIKTFREEKDQTIFILYDVSGSTKVRGGAKSRKIREVASVLYLSAIHQGSTVCYGSFSDGLIELQKEVKTQNKALASVMRILKQGPTSKETNLGKSLMMLGKYLKKRHLVFIVSDFMDSDFEKEIQLFSAKHELVLIHIHDTVSYNPLPLGIIPAWHSEGNRLHWIAHTIWGKMGLDQDMIARRDDLLDRLSKLSHVDRIEIETSEDYVEKLLQFFKKRLLRR